MKVGKLNELDKIYFILECIKVTILDVYVNLNVQKKNTLIDIINDRKIELISKTKFPLRQV